MIPELETSCIKQLSIQTFLHWISRQLWYRSHHQSDEAPHRRWKLRDTYWIWPGILPLCRRCPLSFPGIAFNVCPVLLDGGNNGKAAINLVTVYNMLFAWTITPTCRQNDGASNSHLIHLQQYFFSHASTSRCLLLVLLVTYTNMTGICLFAIAIEDLCLKEFDVGP